MIVQMLEKRNITATDDHQIYVYGFDAAIYTLCSTVGLLIMGFLLGMVPETIVIVLLFYINQTLGGGFHTSTHLKCFLTMAVGLLCCLSTFFLPFSLPVYLGTAVVSLGLMMRYPLILHKNKTYLTAKYPELCKRSRIVLLLQAVCLFGLSAWGEQVYCQALCIALCGCCLSWMTAIMQQRK